MRAAAADLDFEEAARLRDEIKRLRSTELAVIDDPTAKILPSPRGGEGGRAQRGRLGGVGAGRGGSKIHKPTLDEMGIALHHEVAPHRPESAAGATGTRHSKPRRPTLDEIWPGVESIPAKRDTQRGDDRTSDNERENERETRSGPRSTLGRPGMRGGWKPRRR